MRSNSVACSGYFGDMKIFGDFGIDGGVLLIAPVDHGMQPAASDGDPPWRTTSHPARAGRPALPRCCRPLSPKRRTAREAYAMPRATKDARSSCGRLVMRAPWRPALPRVGRWQSPWRDLPGRRGLISSPRGGFNQRRRLGRGGLQPSAAAAPSARRRHRRRRRCEGSAPQV